MIEYLQEILTIFRMFGSFVLVAYIPGYALSYCLFQHQSLDYIERFFISVATSIVVSSLITSLLVLMFGGLQTGVLISVILILIFVFIVIAFYRSRNVLLSRDKLVSISINPSIFNRTCISKRNLLIMIPVIVFILVVPLVRHKNPLPVTEFYVSPVYMEETLKINLKQQKSISLPLEIANHEGEQSSYRIEVWMKGREIWERPHIVVDNNSTWSDSIIIPIPEITDRTLLELHLVANHSEAPVAQLHLWVGTKEDGEK